MMKYKLDRFALMQDMCIAIGNIMQCSYISMQLENEIKSPGNIFLYIIRHYSSSIC